MNTAKQITNPTLKESVKTDNLLKDMFVTYVGNKLNPKDGNVTVEMIVDVLAEEFPEFLMVVAEENFIRGYEQAVADFEESDKKNLLKRKNSKAKKSSQFIITVFALDMVNIWPQNILTQLNSFLVPIIVPFNGVNLTKMLNFKR